MLGIIDIAINRSRTTLSIMALILLAGVVSYLSIPIESDPDVQIPVLIITVPHEGISPEDAERLLIMPTEVELRDVEGIDEMISFGSEGAATVIAQFDVDADPDRALTDTREAVDRAKAKMPRTIEEPIISEATANDWPVAVVNFAGEGVPERVLYQLALKMKDEFESIPAVLEARLAGDREEVLEARVDPAMLQSYGITNSELLAGISNNNRLIAAGSLDSGNGRFSVKVPSLIETYDDVVGIPLLNDADSVVTLDQVAEIRRTFKDRTRYASVNGSTAISLEITKRPGRSVVDTVTAVENLLEKLRPGFPPSVDAFVTQNQAPMALKQVRELIGNIVTALALVMTLVVAALGLRSGLLVGVGIPTSFLFSLILLNYIGYTFNFMVMFGMLLALGMLIDGAIVVTEYADRKMQEGADRKAAFTEAGKRMFWPVTASTATTLAAFLPLFFWPGVSGKFMLYLPVTVFCVLVGSLLYALVFGPTLGALFGKATKPSAAALEQMQILDQGDPRELRGITGAYARILHGAAAAPIGVTLFTVLMLWMSFDLYGTFGQGVTFFTEGEPMRGRASIMARGNLSAAEANTLVSEVEERVLEVAGIKDLYFATDLGRGGSFRGRGSTPADQIGNFFFELYEPSERKKTGTAILEEIRQRTQDLAGIKVEVEPLEMGPPTGKDVQLELSSRQGELLEPEIAKIRAYFDSLPELRDVVDTRSLPGIQWEIEVDREKAALLGADVPTVGAAVQLVTNGVKLGEYRPDDAEEEVDIRVRYPEAFRGIAGLENLKVNTREGIVPISSFVDLQAKQRVDSVQRVDGVRVEYVRANTVPGVLADDMVKKIEAWLDTQVIDPRIDIRFRGANEEQGEAGAFLGIAFLLALLVMYVMLVTQFNSFYQAGLILFAVVMSTAGVLLGLMITGQPFSIILTGTGIVALAGIVVNNNIVLIDTYNHLKREHPELPIRDLIARTGAQRLRPVFLTTVTTIFGLLPIACHTSIDFFARTIEIGGPVTATWVPLTQSVVSGLTFATLLTLIATPAMLALPQQLWRLPQDVKANLRWLRGLFASRPGSAKGDPSPAESVTMVHRCGSGRRCTPPGGTATVVGRQAR